jgi:hypothetical protein
MDRTGLIEGGEGDDAVSPQSVVEIATFLHYHGRKVKASDQRGNSLNAGGRNLENAKPINGIEIKSKGQNRRSKTFFLDALKQT